jgi:hypothetical protein
MSRLSQLPKLVQDDRFFTWNLLEYEKDNKN